MIPVRVTTPDPIVEYFIDCAQEAGEMDACTAMTLRLYGDDAALLPICGQLGKAGYRERQAKCLDLGTIADRILDKLPGRRAAGLVNAGLKHIAHLVCDMAETMSYWTMEDEIEGGCMLPFRYEHARQRNGITFKRMDRRLRSPKFIRRQVKVNAAEHVSHLISLKELVLRRAARFGTEHDPGIMADYRAQINWKRKANDRKLANAALASRKVIRRSLATAISVVGEATVRAFIHGEEVRLVGAETMLVLKKRGSLADVGHGCISIAIADRAGTRLADLCTYIENTPMLDQLTGFALWMQAGEEDRVLQTANITHLAPAGEGHPVIARRKSAIVQAAHEAIDAATPDELAELLGTDEAIRIRALLVGTKREVHRQLTHEQQRERWYAYWEETKGEWTEAMVVFVIGYRDLPIFKTAGAM